MPKISALPAITTLAVDDEMPIVDDSAATTKKVTLTQVLEAMYPIGSIYTNATVSTNPGTLLGFGTWSAFASGRVLVGVDTGQTEFDTLGETGGAKTHTLSTGEIPSHSHLEKFSSGANNGVTGIAQTANQSSVPGINSAYTTDVSGGGGAHNNLQPYITVYMWKRTA